MRPSPLDLGGCPAASQDKRSPRVPFWTGEVRGHRVSRKHGANVRETINERLRGRLRNTSGVSIAIYFGRELISHFESCLSECTRNQLFRAIIDQDPLLGAHYPEPNFKICSVSPTVVHSRLSHEEPWMAWSKVGCGYGFENHPRHLRQVLRPSKGQLRWSGPLTERWFADKMRGCRSRKAHFRPADDPVLFAPIFHDNLR